MWSTQADASLLHTLLSRHEGSWSFKGGGIGQHWHPERSSNGIRIRPVGITTNLLTLYNRSLESTNRRSTTTSNHLIIKPSHSTAVAGNCSGRVASGLQDVGSSSGANHDDACLGTPCISPHRRKESPKEGRESNSRLGLSYHHQIHVRSTGAELAHCPRI